MNNVFKSEAHEEIFNKLYEARRLVSVSAAKAECYFDDEEFVEKLDEVFEVISDLMMETRTDW